MTTLTKKQVLAPLRTGTPEERLAFVKRLPSNGFKDQALTFVGSE
jgi:hypothetical protein